MAPHSSSTHATSLPQIRETFRLPFTGSANSNRHIFYDVKFYPYHKSSADIAPVFMVAGDRQILLCRPSLQKGKSLSVVAAFKDLEPPDSEVQEVINSCAWNFVDQDKPLVSVGGPSGTIKVLNALTGELLTTLLGHGGEVNDLATHPKYPWILASASGDHSVRIWDLRRRIESGENPCLLICGHGQSHKESILTVAWHSGGRYLISAGLDHMICVWTIPNLAPSSEFLRKDKNPGSSRSADETKVIHYPHFITSAVHSNYVDCVCFYGDLVLSKACNEDKIVLWSIADFSSKLPPPGPHQAPKTGEFKDTRNGFVSPPPTKPTDNNNNNNNLDNEISPRPYSLLTTTQPPLFHRLTEFHIPGSEPFYMRFALLTPSPSYPTLHPVLAFANVRSKISFWDLSRLTEPGTGTAPATLTHEPSSNAPSDDVFLRPASGGGGGGGEERGRPQKKRSRTQLLLPPGGNSSSSHTGSPAPSSRSSPLRRSESIATTGVSSNPQDPPFPRADSTAATSLSASGLLTTTANTAGPGPSMRDPVRTPFEPRKPHHAVTVRKVFLVARQAAWSPCGKWCVVVGECGNDAYGVLCERWTSQIG